MNISLALAAIFLAAAQAASPDEAPVLPMTGQRIVNVATEAQLQSAMGNLRDGDTIVLADGVYNLGSSLHVNGRNDVTIRGAAGSTNVVLAGKGMDNRNHGGVLFGVWSNSTNTTIAHLTIRETYDNPIIFNSPAQSPRVYAVRLIDAGSQFIKSNPTDVAAGRGVNDGLVEYCWFEYTGNPPNDHGAGVGYFNGISAHAAKNWVVRGNVFKNLHNPDGSAYPWNPAVLFWRNSSNTLTERNVFINVDRAVAYGLENNVPYHDHAGGVVRNNFVYLAPGMMSAARRASSDGAIIVWNSPATQVDHNTVLLNNNVFYPVQFRFATTTNGAARNNLADGPIHLRDNAAAVTNGNLSSAEAGLFSDPANGDLHLRPGATNVINGASPLNTVTNDFDGEVRPAGGGSAANIGADEFTAVAPEIFHFQVEGTEAVLRFTSQPEVRYGIERNRDLHQPWLQIASNILATEAVVEFLDGVGAGTQSGYYRVKVLQ